MATTDQYTIQGSLFPNRKAVRLLGGATDCAVQADAAAVAFKADATGTIAAWVMVPNITDATSTILGFGDDNVVEFVQFSIEAGLLTLRLTDTTTAEIIYQADAVHFVPHKWYHVAVTQNGIYPKLYVDGVEIAATGDDVSGITKWGSALGGLDKGFIGCANKAGDGTETEEYAGYISGVKVWSKALTAAELASDINGVALSDDATYLRNHWKLETDLLDSATGADNGTAVSGAILVSSANEFTSQLTFGCGIPVVADKVEMCINNGAGFAYVVQAA